MLDLSEIIYAFLVAALLIVAGYQIYFLPQRIPVKRAKIGKASIVDERIPFRPHWVWIYSFAYYPFVLSAILTLSSIREFYFICISYVGLLFSHVTISFFYPIRTPDDWRSYGGTSNSVRFLKFVQHVDRGGNCFPSMHVAVAVLTAIHITANGYDRAGYLIFLVWFFPILISASALYTKQHFAADVLPGFALAIFGYCFYRYALSHLPLEDPKTVLASFFALGACVKVFLLSRYRTLSRWLATVWSREILNRLLRLSKEATRTRSRSGWLGSVE